MSSGSVILLNPVVAARADDFETWLRTVVAPAMQQQNPEQLAQVKVLRATEARDGVVTFAYLIDGSSEDFMLDQLLVKALGPERAQEALQYFFGMLQGEQYGWNFQTVTP